jgi:ribosomal protein S27E
VRLASFPCPVCKTHNNGPVDGEGFSCGACKAALRGAKCPSCEVANVFHRASPTVTCVSCWKTFPMSVKAGGIIAPAAKIASVEKAPAGERVAPLGKRFRELAVR